MDNKQQTYEAPLTQYLLNKASRGCLPMSGTFELTPMCNFSCRMCYVRQTRQEVEQHSRKMMTMAQWLQLAREAREAGMLYLLLTGGEPLIWPDFWPLYEQLSEMGFLISINTNGSLIDERAVERFRKHPPVRLNITLYGASDETYHSLCQVRGSFSRVDRAITLLQEAGIPVKLNGSLTPHNAGDLPAMVEYARARDLIYEVNTYMLPPLRRRPDQVGVNSGRFTPEEAARYDLQYRRLQYGEEAYRHYLDRIRRGVIPAPGLDSSCVDPVDGRIRCRAGSASFWVTWDGYMTPCGMMPEPKEDVTVQTFAQAWQAVAEQSARMRLSGVCRSCPNRQLCHSCAAMAMAETGSASGIPRYLCEMVMQMRAIAQQQDPCSPEMTAEK